MTGMFRGVGAALITPFNEDFTIDYTSLQSLLNHIQEGNVDYIVANGTTSEASTLDLREKEEILDFIKKNNHKKLPLLYGIGANDTRQVLNIIKNTNFDGVDGILTVSPYYNKPSQRGILNHYKKIADAAPVPLIMYNIPGRTASDMSAETIIELSKHDNIIGIKDATGDFDKYLEIKKYGSQDFLLISGDDMVTTPLISIGGAGVISVLANSFPVSFSKCVSEALAGNFEKSTRQILEYVGINDLLYEESNPVGIKEVLRIQGVIKNSQVREPLLKISPELSDRITTSFEQLKNKDN